jgi:phospholipase D1/2
MDQLVWLRIAAVLVICGLLGAAWRLIPVTSLTPDEISASIEPYRHAWYAMPMVMLAFIALGVVPVLLLITLTGLAFGPVLGPIYAMAGCLAGASAGFGIGRWLGLDRVARLGGERVTAVTRSLKRNGTLAVFLLRKVPAPFLLANIVIGASTVRYRDFILGTVLGMGAIVIALAGFGSQFTQALRHPSPARILTASLFVGVPLTLAWFINRVLRRARPAE